jgi:hypothetical protein
MSLFNSGTLVQTPGARDTFDAGFLQGALLRHLSGDWGDLGEEDLQANAAALRDGERLLSSYKRGPHQLYIITEADRSVTTLLLPSEY